MEENNLQVRDAVPSRKVPRSECSADNPWAGIPLTLRAQGGRGVLVTPNSGGQQHRSHIRSASKRQCPGSPADANGPTGNDSAPRQARQGGPQGNCDGQRFPPQRFFSSCWRRCPWNYWKPASQTADTTRVVPPSAEAAPWFSIAILPFAAPGGAATNAQLADGLTRDLTVAFGRARWAQVVSYALASTCKKARQLTLTLIGRELNVRYLVEGEVHFAGQVSSPTSGSSTPAPRRRCGAIARRSDAEVAEQAVAALLPASTQQLRPGAGCSRAPSHRYAVGNPSRCDGTGRASSANVWGQEGDPLKGALEAHKLYDEALRLDPNLVWALLGRGWTLDTELDLNRHAARDRLVQELDYLSRRAVALDGDDPRVWALRSQGLVTMAVALGGGTREANSKGPEPRSDARRAHGLSAWLMGMMGKPAEALPLVDRALELDPVDVGFALRLQMSVVSSARPLRGCDWRLPEKGGHLR